MNSGVFGWAFTGIFGGTAILNNLCRGIGKSGDGAGWISSWDVDLAFFLVEQGGTTRFSMRDAAAPSGALDVQSQCLMV